MVPVGDLYGSAIGGLLGPLIFKFIVLPMRRKLSRTLTGNWGRVLLFKIW